MASGSQEGVAGGSPGTPAHGLRRNAIGLGEMVANNIAEIAPAIATILVLAAIAQASGVGTPFVVLIGIIGFLCHINTTAEFSRVSPSAGYYATYCARTFGPVSGGTVGLGYLIGMFFFYIATFFQAGIWTQTAVMRSFGFNLPWWIPAIVLEIFVATMMLRGVKISVRTAVSLFLIEVTFLFICAIGILVVSAPHINFAGFNPHNIMGGTQGFGLGFVIAIFLFVGASGSSPLAEEAQKPRKSLPIAILIATLVAAFIYLVMSWVMVIGLHGDTHALTHADFPFVAATIANVPHFQYLLYFAGFTSSIGVMFASQHAGSRILFNVARDKLVAGCFAHVHDKTRVPSRAIVAPVVVAMILTLILGVFTGAENAFDYTATFSTDLFVIVYIVANIATVPYFWRNHHDQFSWWRHCIIPLVGAVIFIYPLYESVLPSQPEPFRWFGLGIIVVYLGCYLWSVARKSAIADMGKRLADSVIPATHPAE